MSPVIIGEASDQSQQSYLPLSVMGQDVHALTVSGFSDGRGQMLVPEWYFG